MSPAGSATSCPLLLGLVQSQFQSTEKFLMVFNVSGNTGHKSPVIKPRPSPLTKVRTDGQRQSLTVLLSGKTFILLPPTS